MSTTEVLETQALPVNTSVALRIIQTTPAVVEFNYIEIEANLDAVLVKYQGLVFTESTASDCKKTIAELRKGQKALDVFRISTKKQLTESVTAFENQCKKLQVKFEKVIDPLTIQNDQFELDRKEKKRVEIQGVIDALVTENGLTGTYALQLTISDEYLNKGKTIKAIKAELSSTAKNAKLQQDKDEQDSQLIKAKVELANAQYQLTSVLMPEQYIRHLAHHSVANIELLITADAQAIKDREDKAAEALTAKLVEAPKVESIQLDPKPAKAPEFVASTYAAPMSAFTPTAARVRIENLTTAVYEVTGTEEQLSTLEAYLDTLNLRWVDRPND